MNVERVERMGREKNKKRRKEGSFVNRLNDDDCRLAKSIVFLPLRVKGGLRVEGNDGGGSVRARVEEGVRRARGGRIGSRVFTRVSNAKARATIGSSRSEGARSRTNLGRGDFGAPFFEEIFEEVGERGGVVASHVHRPSQGGHLRGAEGGRHRKRGVVWCGVCLCRAGRRGRKQLVVTPGTHDTREYEDEKKKPREEKRS